MMANSALKLLITNSSFPKSKIMDDKYKITEEDIDNCWPYHKQYLIEILNDEYDVSLAREDLISLIDTKYDNRTNIEKN